MRTSMTNRIGGKSGVHGQVTDRDKRSLDVNSPYEGRRYVPFWKRRAAWESKCRYENIAPEKVAPFRGCEGSCSFFGMRRIHHLTEKNWASARSSDFLSFTRIAY